LPTLAPLNTKADDKEGGGLSLQDSRKSKKKLTLVTKAGRKKDEASELRGSIREDSSSKFEIL